MVARPALLPVGPFLPPIHSLTVAPSPGLLAPLPPSRSAPLRSLKPRSWTTSCWSRHRCRRLAFLRPPCRRCPACPRARRRGRPRWRRPRPRKRRSWRRCRQSLPEALGALVACRSGALACRAGQGQGSRGLGALRQALQQHILPPLAALPCAAGLGSAGRVAGGSWWSCQPAVGAAAAAGYEMRR